MRAALTYECKNKYLEGSGVVSYIILEMPLCEAGLYWKPQDVEDARIVADYPLGSMTSSAMGSWLGLQYQA